MLERRDEASIELSRADRLRSMKSGRKAGSSWMIS